MSDKHPPNKIIFNVFKKEGGKRLEHYHQQYKKVRNERMTCKICYKVYR